MVRNRPAVLADMETLLAQMRREFKWSVSTRLDVLEMPAAALEQLQRGAQGVAVLTAAQLRGLEAEIAKGAAHRLGHAELSSRDGVPNTVASGRHTTYLADFEVELAEKSSITNPIIQSIFSGLQLVVTASRTSGDGAVAMEVRATRSGHAPRFRRMETPGGHIELPRLEIFRVHTGLLVPAGGTVLLAAQGEGEVRQVWLLTPTVQRQR
jgi:hypothetical protein